MKVLEPSRAAADRSRRREGGRRRVGRGMLVARLALLALFASSLSISLPALPAAEALAGQGSAFNCFGSVYNTVRTSPGNSINEINTSTGDNT